MRKVLKVIAWIVAIIVVLDLLIVVFVLLVGGISIPLVMLLGMVYGMIIQAYLHYRAARQDEFLYVLAGAAESGAPLAPALRAYLRDRPESGWRAFWTITILFFVAPGSYWLWYRRNSFDQKVGRIAQRLEQGYPLHVALEAAPSVASRATVLAVAVGESTGRLALSLRRSIEGRLATVWLETLPRLFYPLGVLLFLFGIGAFWLVFIYPKVQRIGKDLEIQMPALTTYVGHTGDFLSQYSAEVSLFATGVVGLALFALLNPTLRWYIPGLGTVYRMHVRSRVLKMLAVLLEAGKPVPEAFIILADSGALPAAVVSRLNAVRFAVEQGEPLSDSLFQAGLLPRSMAPLVKTSERAHNLPWALAELGNHLAGQALWGSRRLSLASFSIAVVAVGVLVGLLVIGMFFPLVKIMSEMAV